MATTVQKAIVISSVVATIGGVTGILSLTGTFTTTEPTPTDAGPPPSPDAGPPPPPTGRQVSVTLRPLDGGTSKLVSFGLPLPPGVLSDPTKIRVRRATTGGEIPAYTRSLGNWQAIPPPELRCGGVSPSTPGIRSVLIQFPLTMTAGVNVPLLIDVGTTPSSRLASPVDPLTTYRVFDDPGILYNGTEGFREPSTLALIDHTWLSCAGLHLMEGQSDLSPETKLMDDAERNFFYTYIGYYKSLWSSPTSDWPVAAPTSCPVVGQCLPDLVSSENGVWLYQRPQTILSLYLRTGMPDALRAFYQAFWHYRQTIFTEQECVGASYPAYCKGFNRLKNPDKNQPYKDTKYSYAEDFASYYWLTGDETVRPYIDWIRAAQDTNAAQTYYHTERFHAYSLQGPVIQYEVTGNASSIAYAKTIVDLLWTRSNSTTTGCWVGNDEWGPSGFSPWMGPMLMHQLLRYYQDAPTDVRVPTLLARVADCIVNHGIAWNSEVEQKTFLLPFYGASAVASPPTDSDGDNPWVGVEHASNVAQGLSIGYMFETNASKKAILRAAILNLQKGGEWAFNYWTRTTPNVPKFRLSPWRKHAWWFHHAGQIQWALFGKPTLE
jgi:hypothetical protein